MNDRLGSIFNLTENLTEQNKMGVSVLRLVAMNPNLGLPTLSYFANSSDCALLSDITANNRLSIDLIYKIYDKRSACAGIEWGLVFNRNAPPDILRALAKQIEKHKSYAYALREHPNMPADLKEYLSKVDQSRTVANP